MLRLIVLLLVALTPGLQPALAAEGIIGKDDRVAVEPDTWPLMAVGRLLFKTGGFCTATLITPDTVLMAQHCVPKLKNKAGPPQASLSYFVAGYSKGRHKGSAQGQAYVFGSDHPTPRPAGMKTGGLDSTLNDWAYIRVKSFDGSLSRVRPAEPFTGDLEDLVNETITLAGYHHDRPSVLSVQTNCRVLAVVPDSPLFLHDCDLKGRASGSPMFHGEGDEARLIGIALAYTRSTDGSTVGIGRRLPDVAP